jgi:hypothetical protein
MQTEQLNFQLASSIQDYLFTTIKMPVVSRQIQHHEIHKVYFCTATCFGWLPLIEEGQVYFLVYRWFEHLKLNGCHVTGYVIMPNHFHVLLYPTHSGTSLNKLIGEGKRFMAYDIVRNRRGSVRHESPTFPHTPRGLAPVQGKYYLAR